MKLSATRSVVCLLQYLTSTMAVSPATPSRLRSRTSCDGRYELERANAELRVALCGMERAIAEQEALHKTVFPLQPISAKVSALLEAYSSASSRYSKRLSYLSSQASPEYENRTPRVSFMPVTSMLDRAMTREPAGTCPSVSQRTTKPRSHTSGMPPGQDIEHILAKRLSLWNDIEDDYTAWLNMTDQLRAVLVQSARVRNTMTADERKGFMRLIDTGASARRECLESLTRAWGTTCGPVADEWVEFCYNDGVTVEVVPPP